jgi:TetR/AcrR family transcriptional repressor of lmrAB and yxaGH operons
MAPVAKHRDTLISTSLSLFQRQGYAATGLAEILAESGAPRGSLYHYFPEGKEAIAEAALNVAAVAMETRIREAAARIPDPAQCALAYGQALAATMAESGFSRGCQVATVALEAAPQSARLTAASRGAFDAWCAAIGDMLRAAGVADARASALADFMISAFQGAMILARVRQSSAPILSTAEELARLFAREISAQGDVG